MKNLFLAVLLVSTSVMTFAQTSVVPYTFKDVMPDGMIYYLPKTTLKVKAKAECTISKPGPFFRYAERFFACKNVIVEDLVEWKLVDIKVKSESEANTDLAFMVKPDYKNKSVSNLLTLNNKGVIVGVNVKEGVKNNKHKKSPTIKSKKQVETPELIFNMNVLGEEALLANSIPKMAEMAAKQVYRIRESRMSLLNGEVDILPSGSAMEEVLAEMDRLEKELLELFFGKTCTYTETRDYEYTPEDDATKHVLFRISIVEGLLSSDNIIGDPIYLNLKGTYPLAPTAPEKAPKVLGFAYTVPGIAEIEIFDSNRIYLTHSMKMPQFGYTLHLVPTMTDQLGISLRYNVNTGEIKSVSK